MFITNRCLSPPVCLSVCVTVLWTWWEVSHFRAAEGGFTMSANIHAHTYMQSIVLFHLTVADRPLAAATLVRARGSEMHEVF